MSTIKFIQQAVNYIEANLKSELTVAEVADQAGFSPYHFSRMFCNIVGMPVSGYITKRRLYHAIYAVQNGVKSIDAALEYGFDTYAGFYKAFIREFGCSPSKYLKLTAVSQPEPVNLLEEGKFMLTRSQIKQLLKNWDIDCQAEIKNTLVNNRKTNDTWYIGQEYVFKTSRNIAGLKTHIAISQTLSAKRFQAATAIPTKNGQDFITENDRYYILTRRIQGQPLTSAERYNSDRYQIGQKYGAAIAQLHQVLAEQDQNITVDDHNLLETVLNWALPKVKQLMEQWGYALPEEFYQDYQTKFSQLYPKLPRQIIHRDPNPSNIIFANNEVTGFVDFVISERNIRLFDPCYCATGILSEADNQERSYDQWPEILQGILAGYNQTLNLNEAEKEAVPYVIYSIQLIFIAWLDGRDELKDIAIKNREMLAWLWKNHDIIKETARL